jgi:hypothetical protein
MWNGEHIRATADGELALHTLSLEGYYKLAKQRPALLEAKRRFSIIRDGEPVITDEVLGQFTCEALASRLGLEAQEEDRDDDKMNEKKDEK